MIEKRITQQMLEMGELALTPGDCADLTLPEHSTTVTIELEGDAFFAQWSGRSRHLGGDILHDRLQDYGQINGLLRLRLVDQVYRLVLLPPGTALQYRQPIRTPITHTKPTAVQNALKRRATVDRQFHSDDEYDWGAGSTQTTGFLTGARKLLSEQLKAAGFDALELVELRLQGEELATLDDFEELLAVDVANVDRMPHQEAVARHALSRLRGRAVLADEVGLGKTIEAGLAVKELTLRGLAKRVLILCPAPLRDQWREEMNTKFDLPFDVAYRGFEVGNQEKLILSLTLARGEIDKLTKQPWDIVIIDEAHRAAGSGARKTRELITALTTACRYAFFLTATPVQNDLLELYRLVELLRPGTFTSVSEFKRQYITRSDPRTPNDPAALRRLISSAMIRTTRAQAGVDRVTRRAVDVPVTLGRKEQELYTLSRDLLRNVMRDSSDTMRRRSLALRLTASPFSMGTTALRMAERHPDSRVRGVLAEVGHMAMDITDSARENKAMDITRDWMREHGRVLIFTQHTDTVTALLRRMDGEGIHARSFHGSMSPSERAATIAAFRSGEAPIMISTDAGAEGQNLQFCNCVLNYDLPWNPMRIEQRIGRVDRLTQPRDEVFVANLYARGTIDESVYQLLAKKLRMFELLFGQVTTILGELDDSKSATFETRVMEALFAENDVKMGRLLTALGTELVDARERATTLIAADSGLSSWMATAVDHRKGLTKAGSAELMPEATERARIRQRRVQAWVRRVLAALGAESIHDTGEGEGAFLTVKFDEELTDELGGRTLLHLAFDRLGMEHHPDAELCAVGSPVFDELLGLLRMRGDLHATVPVIPDDIGPSPFKHSPTTTLVSRRLIPAGTWSGHATFRATIGEAETTEHIITADINGDNEVRLQRRPLQDGESLPPAFDTPFKVMAAFERTAASQLEALRRERAKQVGQGQTAELERIRGGYQAQISEANSDDRSRLRRALASEERRLDRQPDVRARAKVLALTLDEDDWVVEETWAGPGEVEGKLTYEWGLSEAPPVGSDASDADIDVLALCAGSHWVDESEVVSCGSCRSDLCGACGDDSTFIDCPVCAESCCGVCRSTTGGLCLQCASPERAPELDEQYATAWRLNHGATVLVGERVAELVRPGESVRSVVVRDEDVADPGRIRMRSYAIQNGLPADSGLALRDLTIVLAPEDSNHLELRRSTTTGIEFSPAASPGSSIDSMAVSDLPESAEVSVASESDAKLALLLEKLRGEVPPPTPPSVILTRRATSTDLHLTAEQLVERVSVVADDGALETVSEQHAPLRWRPLQTDYSTLAEAQLAGMQVSLQRRNEAVLVTTRAGISLPPVTAQWIAVPDGTSANDQLAWFDALAALDTPGGRVGRRTDEVTSMVGPFPSPTECELVERTTLPIVEFAEPNHDDHLAAARSESLAALGSGSGKRADDPAPNPVPIDLARALISHAERPFTTVVRNGFAIRETWQGHATATHEYRVFDGQPVAPVLDNGYRGTDFGVCRDGHFHEAGVAAQCESCRTWACRACDDVEHQASIPCPDCSAGVCRRCLSSDHTMPTLQCVMCSDQACSGCGRDPEVKGCADCDRKICSACRQGDLCPACRRLTLASPEQISALPPELAALGATVLMGSDDYATTLVINRSGGIEQAVIRDGLIDRWVAFGRNEIDSSYELRLAASREFGTQVAPAVEVLEAEPSIDTPHLAQSKRHFYPAWLLPGRDESHRSSQSFSSPEGDLARFVADELPTATQLPTANEVTPRHIEQLVMTAPQPAITMFAIRWDRVGHDVIVNGSGIGIRTIDRSNLSDSEFAWTDGDALPTWVADDWSPAPTVRAYASASGVEAVVIGIASLLALGIRVDDQAEWYSITTSPHAPAATSLARWMGLADADQVGTFTEPKAVILSTVLNAIEVNLSVLPLGNVEAGPRPSHENATPDAVQAWMPSAEIRTPELRPLNSDIRWVLEQRMRISGPRMTLTIGAHIEQLVTVEGGHVWRYEANLSPGQTNTRRFDTITRHPLHEGVLDREGHFGPDGVGCRYCDSRVCGACVDGLFWCDCCEAAICKRCLSEPRAALWLCPACVGMRPATRSEARQHGRLLSARGMLIGTDAHHVVVVEQAKNRWTRQAYNGEKVPIASPSVTKFLSDRMEWLTSR